MIARQHLLPFALLLLAGASNCAKSKIQVPTTISATKQALIVTDKTSSGDENALKRFAAHIKSWLTGCADVHQVAVVPVGANGKGIWNAPVQKFTLPDDPRQPFDEEAERAKVRKPCHNLRRCEDRLIAEAKARYETEMAEKFAQYQKNRTEIVNAVIAAVLQRPTLEPSCTNIGEMADFIAQTNAHYILWLSDCEHDCRPPLKPQKFSGKVLLGLLPLMYEPNGGLTKRQEVMRQLYSTATIKPVVTLNEQELRAFFRAD